MKNRVLENRFILFGFLSIISITFLFHTGCRKKIDTNNQPIKFTELKVASNFEFESFREAEATIKVPSLKQTAQNIVQIYQGNPAEGGKLIMTGPLDQNNQFKNALRLPTRLANVFVGRLSADGNNEYVSVPITGNTVTYDFGKKGG
ncbi:MAG: hypothetical protein ABIK52_07680, partial [Bacteroidota bacterium]